jgi:hypothetical protein
MSSFTVLLNHNKYVFIFVWSLTFNETSWACITDNPNIQPLTCHNTSVAYKRSTAAAFVDYWHALAPRFENPHIRSLYLCISFFFFNNIIFTIVIIIIFYNIFTLSNVKYYYYYYYYYYYFYLFLHGRILTFRFVLRNSAVTPALIAPRTYHVSRTVRVILKPILL